MSYIVPFVDPRTHYANFKSQIDTAIIDCLTQGDLIYRDQLHSFEANLASFVGVKHALGLNSGYHALHFSLLAAGIGAGDEVITVAHTFVATVSAIIHCGATPVLIDVADDYNMDVDLIEPAITEKTRALLPVHLNGRICEMDRIMALASKYKLVVIEDAAQSLGATFDGQMAGSIGATGCFSFYPFKILGGLGDGGALTTNDPDIAKMVARIRWNGEDRETGEYHHHGYTALLDNIQAAVLDVKLRYFEGWVNHRREIAHLYRQGLEDVTQLRLPHFNEERQIDVFQNYVIRLKERDSLREHLTKSGIETLVSWPKPMWEHHALGLGTPDLPNTSSICKEVISLPMSAETTPEHVDFTVQAIRKFFS